MTLVIHRLPRASSTQDEARRLLADGGAGPGHVVLADEQSEGRGRFGRAWLSPSGGFYATYVVEQHPRIALVAGVAVLRALDRYGVSASLKWPNDVIVERKKLGGILIETAENSALVGIGLNLTETPLETAMSILTTGQRVARGDLVVAIGVELAGAAISEDLLADYRKRLATLGERVRVTTEDGERPIEGTAVDIDPEGRLLVETDKGVCVVSSGDCIELRAVAG